MFNCIGINGLGYKVDYINGLSKLVLKNPKLLLVFVFENKELFIPGLMFIILEGIELLKLLY